MKAEVRKLLAVAPKCQPVSKARLTKKWFMSLPEGSCLTSTMGPSFIEVNGDREERWRNVGVQQYVGRVMCVYESVAAYLREKGLRKDETHNAYIAEESIAEILGSLLHSVTEVLCEAHDVIRKNVETAFKKGILKRASIEEPVLEEVLNGN